MQSGGKPAARLGPTRSLRTGAICSCGRAEHQVVESRKSESAYLSSVLVPRLLRCVPPHLSLCQPMGSIIAFLVSSTQLNQESGTLNSCRRALERRVSIVFLCASTFFRVFLSRSCTLEIRGSNPAILHLCFASFSLVPKKLQPYFLNLQVYGSQGHPFMWDRRLLREHLTLHPPCGHSTSAPGAFSSKNSPAALISERENGFLHFGQLPLPEASLEVECQVRMHFLQNTHLHCPRDGSSRRS